MKKVAVMLYDHFCMFELSAALETFALSGMVQTGFFGEQIQPYRSEEGLLAMAEHSISELCADNYDALLLPGFDSEEMPLMDNNDFIFICCAFHQQQKVLAAISAGPAFLLKAGVLKGQPFMCGIPKEGLLEEGYSEEDLTEMLDWGACCKQYDTLKFKRSGNIVTSVAYGFREWGVEIGNMLGIKTYPKTFGLDR